MPDPHQAPGQSEAAKFSATVVPRSAGDGKEPFQCRIIGHPNQTLVPDGIYERVASNEDIE
jgi:hypothetical protein